MNTTQAMPDTSTKPVRVAANYAVTKRLGNWTTADRFEVRSHRGHAVLDLRSPQIRPMRSASTSTSITPC